MSLSVSLIALALIQTACGLRNTPTPTPELPLHTATPTNTASIRGVVWHDLCANLSVEDVPPQGCVDDDGMNVYIANGYFEANEVGISDVWVELGAGPCPSDSTTSVKTDEQGQFIFENLLPGEYCTFPRFEGSHLPASVEPGIWTFPKSTNGSIRGMATLTLRPGEHREKVNFGWDFFNKPVLPTPEPTPEPTSTPRCVDSATLVKDVTIPDGTRIDPGDSFTKIWRLRNTGTCTWTQEYDLIFLSGHRMDAYTVVPLRGKVSPGQVVDLSVGMKAPKNVGTFWGYWMLRNEQGGIFGVSEDASGPFWVKILVEPDITDWRGEYFNNRKLEGDPVLIRNDEDIDFNWKQEAPSAHVPADNFSARWTRRLRFNAGVYRFAFLVDDGVRLWVDDRLVLDDWETGAARDVSVTLQMTEGKHDLKVEYFEQRGKARIHLDIDKISPQNGADWTGTYWFNTTMDSKWALVKAVDAIDFNWGSNSPAQGIPSDNFSIRWDRTVGFDSGLYRFYARADDGIRVEVDGERIIDEWHTSNASETYTAEVSLSGSLDVMVEYFERGGNAKVSFWWEYLEPQNRPPVANADYYEIVANEVFIVPAPGVMSNDEDPDGDSLTATLVNATSNGTIALDEDGSFVYHPDADFVGDDGFTYKISDGELDSDNVSVTLTVLPTNTPPTAYDDAFTVGQGETIDVAPPGVLENDIDEDGQSLSAQLEAIPSQGIVEFSQDGSFRYTPEADFTGQDQFTYRASDGEAISEIALVVINVLSINNPPQASNDHYEIEEDQILSMSAPGILENDLDPDGQPIHIVLEEEPRFGSLILHEEGAFEYKPAVDFSGEDRFTYRLSDGIATSELATVLILVLPVNDLPAAVDDEVSGIQDQVLEIDVLSNDLGLGDGPIMIIIESMPSEGTVEIIEGTILYSPNTGFFGEDEFSYSLSDQDGEQAQASVFIQLSSVEA
jgi:hypothetical protein